MNNEYQTALPLDFPDEPQSRNAYDVPLTNEQIKQVLPKLKYREQIGNIGTKSGMCNGAILSGNNHH
jgi:hypothetical protein